MFISEDRGRRLWNAELIPGQLNAGPGAWPKWASGAALRPLPWPVSTCNRYPWRTSRSPSAAAGSTGKRSATRRATGHTRIPTSGRQAKPTPEELSTAMKFRNAIPWRGSDRCVARGL